MLKLLNIILFLASKIATYLERKQLMDAGRDRERKVQLEKTVKKIRQAQSAVRLVRRSADRMRNDPHNRH